MINQKVTLFEDYIIQKQKEKGASGNLSGLLRSICFAAKIVNREVNKAGLVDILGNTGNSNIYGEEVKKLDEFANSQFINFLRISEACAGVASEEEESFIAFDNLDNKSAKYVVCLDPLDGSSNIDVNASIGTIFGIYKRVSLIGKPCTLEDFLQPGTALVASGYIIYGSSTMLVLCTGNSVDGFTLDPSVGEFCLSHPNLKTPSIGTIYSINESYKHKYNPHLVDFIRYCKEEDKTTKRPYNSRYIGSMVADFHRNLIKGGLFMYPSLKGYPNGKLRLQFECCPLAHIVEIAGGKATNGNQRILNIQPSELHQRTPIFIGSIDMVEKAEEFLRRD